MNFQSVGLLTMECPLKKVERFQAEQTIHWEDPHCHNIIQSFMRSMHTAQSLSQNNQKWRIF